MAVGPHGSAFVYQFTVWDPVARLLKFAEVMGTLDVIWVLNGVPVESSIREVDFDDLDSNGIYAAQPEVL